MSIVEAFLQLNQSKEKVVNTEQPTTY